MFTGMSKRDFLRLCLSGPALAAGLSTCAPPRAGETSSATGSESPRGAPRSKIAAICFDLFTLFDPRSVIEQATRWVPGQATELCEAWRSRQFEYAWLRVAAGQYLDFRSVTEDALVYAARGLGLSLSSEARESLVNAYSQLEPWPDTREQLSAWRHAGLELAPLANYSPVMLERLLANAGLSQAFDVQISTHVARTFKPDPRAYALGVSTLGLRREQIAFAAFGGWDAAGAKWFGFPTFWVNRLGVPREELAPPPDATGPTLAELARFVAEW